MPIELTKLTEAEFSRFAEFIYKRAGIHLAPEKRTLLSNRLRRRLRALGFESFEEYYRKLEQRDFADEELPEFLSAVTTNETYFFRNERLWQTVEQRLIPEFVDRKARTRAVKIWSAASSSGEEAYTAAIVLRETLPDFEKWKVTIVATDISKKVLDVAQQGLYSEYAVARMSAQRRQRWFTRVEDKFQLADEIRRMVRFSFHNLRDPFPLSGFDLVMLRNVLMYFDTPMKVRCLQVVCDAVTRGGYLFVGDVDPIRSSPELLRAMSLSPDAPGLYHHPSDPAERPAEKA